MLRQQTITNTWACDGLNCPTPARETPEDPYFVVRVHKPGNQDVAPVEVDLCPVCIQTITSPAIVQAVAEMG